MKIAILFVLFQLTSAYYLSESPCPSRPVHQNFDINKIAGRWYTVMQYEDEYGSSLICGHGNYTVLEEQTLKIIDCDLKVDKYTCLTGVITLDKPNRIPSEGVTNYAYFEDRGTVIDQFKYLSVDYDSYAIAYNCKESEGGKSIHSLWVSSRTPTLNDNVKSAVTEILNKHFDTKDLKSVEQSFDVCGYRA